MEASSKNDSNRGLGPQHDAAIRDAISSEAQTNLAQLVAKRQEIIATAEAEGRPTSYRKDEELAKLGAQIKRLTGRKGRRLPPLDPPLNRRVTPR